MSFTISDNVSRVHLLELLILSKHIENLLESLNNNNENINSELYVTYMSMYKKLKETEEIGKETSFEEYLEDLLFEFKLEITQRRQN
jgi:hypothetical protein